MKRRLRVGDALKGRFGGRSAVVYRTFRHPVTRQLCAALMEQLGPQARRCYVSAYPQQPVAYNDVEVAAMAWDQIAREDRDRARSERNRQIHISSADRAARNASRLRRVAA